MDSKTGSNQNNGNTENTESLAELSNILKLQNDNKDNYNYRLLEQDDYYKDYFQLLSQLTSAEKPEYSLWVARFNTLKNLGLSRIIVVEDLTSGKIIATITSLIELKFIRNLGVISHIEDFVIDKECRGKGLGSKLINICIKYAKSIGCYKVLLDCDEKIMPFYEKIGFERKSQGMAIYL